LYLTVFAILALLGAFLQLVLKRERTTRRITEIVLLYWFAIAIGASGIFAFAGHTFRADQVAAGIGWPAGNPFQQEVAFADLALGVLGLACIAIRENFWTATAVATAVMYWGDALGHAYQLLHYGNHHPGNAGTVLWGTIAVPAVTIALLLWRARVLRDDASRDRARVGIPQAHDS